MKIGIIGGGQLGMMMAQEARKLNHTIVSLDPKPNASIKEFSDCHIAKDYNDEEVLLYMDEVCDVITYEFENVNLEVLKKVESKIPQKLRALEVSRNRIIEKNYAKNLGIKTPKFTKVATKDSIFFPSILKTTTGGYDGKGQQKITDKSIIDQINLEMNMEYICEELIHFDYEISVVATRDFFGNIAFYPVPKNTHKNGILHTSVVDESIPVDIQQKAMDYTTLILEDLHYVGTLAVEYFVCGEDVLFNEFAPRPHNSGHYTNDGCSVSQFKNHILAITNETVEVPKLKSPTLMINVLGQNKRYYDKVESLDKAIITDYKKNSTRKNRKIGHINILYSFNEDVHQIIDDITKE